MREVCLKLPDETLRALQKYARGEDITVGQIVREAVDRELHRRSAPTPPEPEQNIVKMPMPLHDAIEAATGWHDLARRLRQHSAVLVERNGALVIEDSLSHAELHRIEDLNASYESLLARFQAPFPGSRTAGKEAHVPLSARAPDRVALQNAAMN